MNCPRPAFAFALPWTPLCGGPLKFGFANTSTSFSHFELLLFDRSQPFVDIADTTDPLSTLNRLLCLRLSTSSLISAFLVFLAVSTFCTGLDVHCLTTWPTPPQRKHWFVLPYLLSLSTSLVTCYKLPLNSSAVFLSFSTALCALRINFSALSFSDSHSRMRASSRSFSSINQISSS
uniref:Uncharacterized protein n=1 Tax=Caenorhabditis japonica TaxID=281687 RepID=A0A8R1ECM4_CAEJA